jgi:hypothetical protein
VNRMQFPSSMNQIEKRERLPRNSKVELTILGLGFSVRAFEDEGGGGVGC